MTELHRSPTTVGTGHQLAAAVRAYLRWARQDTRSLWSTVQDWYVGLLGAVTMLMLGFAFAQRAFHAPDCGAQACLPYAARDPLAGALTLVGLGLLVVAAALAGPVSAGRARLRWTMSGGADRGLQLRGSLLLVTVLAAAWGGVVGGLAGLATISQMRPGPLLVGAALGALVGAGVPACLVPRQRIGTAAAPGRAALVAGVVVAALGAGGAALLLVLPRVAVGPARPGPATAPTLWAVAAGLLVADALLIGRARRSLAGIPARELGRGAEVVEAASSSTLMLDMAATQSVTERRRVSGRGRYRSRPGRARGVAAVLARETQSLPRRLPAGLLRMLLVPVAIVLGELVGTAAGLVAAGVVASETARAVAGPLRTWLASSALRRALPQRFWQVTAALSVWPTVIGVLTGCLTVSALPLPAWAGVVVGMGAVAGVLRGTDELDVDVGELMATPMGAVPTGLIARVVHGPDLAIGVALLLAFSTSPLVLVVAAAALLWQVTRTR